MKVKLGKTTITTRMVVVLVFILLTTATATLAISLQYYYGRNMAKEATTELLTQTASDFSEALLNLGLDNGISINLLTANKLLLKLDDNLAIFRSFGDVLETNPLLASAYLARGDGTVLELINLDNSSHPRSFHDAIHSDRWLAITVTQTEDGSLRRLDYYDASFRLRRSRETLGHYDPRTRSWYQSAKDTPGIHGSDIYLMDQRGIPGRTISKRVGSSDTVVAIDFAIITMTEWLRRQPISELGDVFAFYPNGIIVASSAEPGGSRTTLKANPFELSDTEKRLIQSHSPLTVSNKMDWPPFDYATIGEPTGYSIDVLNLISEMTGLRMEFVNGYSRAQLIDRFKKGQIDLLHSELLSTQNTHLGLASNGYLKSPYALVTAGTKETITDLSQFSGQRLAVSTDSPIAPLIQSQFSEIDIVEIADSLELLQAVRSGDVAAAVATKEVLRHVQADYFLDGLSYQENLPLLIDLPVHEELHLFLSQQHKALLPLFNRALAAITVEQRETLRGRWLLGKKSAMANQSGIVPLEIMIDAGNMPELQNRLIAVQYKNEPYYLYLRKSDRTSDILLYGVLASQASVHGPLLNQVKLSIAITAGFLLLLLPFCWVFATPIVRPVNQLAIQNDKIRRRQYGSVMPVRSSITEIKQLSQSMIKMVDDIQAHEQAQRDLMDAFIRLIAQAIDDKSPYTGGHCERVPELALMLAKRASASELPAFKDFRLENEEQWREYRVAAWLHDCGKITIPEHVVDKGSKLETIHNRIHEVRARFEVLWRDAEIHYLEQCEESPSNEKQYKQALLQSREQLQNDFEFIAQCNLTDHPLEPETQRKLQKLSETTWQRHFDSRVGLSPVEELRQPTGAEQLPVLEPLLADKPQHIIKRERTTEYPKELNIDMDIPEHLYNQGELYNLASSPGTLTDEDSFKLKEHIISTIKMLESLPFPEELKNVPRYASTHHETMRGTGYPRKISGEQLSIPERLLTIADLFESLTAVDHPHRKPRLVSAALDALYEMVKVGDIDADCFELFVRGKVYLRYAKQFLHPEQIDTVDEENYLASV